MSKVVRLMFPITLVVCSATPAFAQNLLVNPTFDSGMGLSGWSWSPDVSRPDPSLLVPCTGSTTCGRMELSIEECCAQPSGASATIGSSFYYPEGIEQCVTGIVPGLAYDFGGWMHIQQEVQPGDMPGTPMIWVLWSKTAACASSDDEVSTGAVWTSAMAWERRGSSVVAPPGSQSARVALAAGATGLSGRYVNMWFDSVFFGPSGSVPVTLQTFVVD
ncbi:MAG: hypothetical protein J0L88_07080 [Xanthomonadales bacterium]|nr:hypothetical protein [Xanthomonadales bacterium]